MTGSMMHFGAEPLSQVAVTQVQIKQIADLAEQLGIAPDQRGDFQKKVLDLADLGPECAEAWTAYYVPGMGRKQARAFKAGFAAGQRIAQAKRD